MDITREEFKKKIKAQRVVGAGPNKISNCYGIYNYFNYYKHTRPKEHKFCLDHRQYSEIVHAMHKLMRDELFNFGEVKLPYNLGSLILFRESVDGPYFENGKLKIPHWIDWDKTLDLWYEDEEAHANRTKVYFELSKRYKVIFRSIYGKYKNQLFYKFNLTREFRQTIAKRAKENTLDNFFVSKK